MVNPLISIIRAGSATRGDAGRACVGSDVHKYGGILRNTLLDVRGARSRNIHRRRAELGLARRIHDLHMDAGINRRHEDGRRVRRHSAISATRIARLGACIHYYTPPMGSSMLFDANFLCIRCVLESACESGVFYGVSTGKA